MRNRVATLAVAAVLPLTAVASLAAASQAGADPNSKRVVVTGSVDDCPDGSGAVSVSITTNRETRTDRGTDVEDAGKYSITLKNVPVKSQKATATVICETDSYKVPFTLRRPAGAGTTLTVNLEP